MYGRSAPIFIIGNSPWFGDFVLLRAQTLAANIYCSYHIQIMQSNHLTRLRMIDFIRANKSITRILKSFKISLKTWACEIYYTNINANDI